MDISNSSSYLTNFSYPERERPPIEIFGPVPKRSDNPDSSILEILTKRKIEVSNSVGQRFSTRRESVNPRKLGIISEISAVLTEQSPPKVLLTDFVIVRGNHNERFEIPLNRQRLVSILRPNLVR